ncbi:hypothetical protein HNS38_06830 [Lentimicrobium sp. L6]|uniref:hypothetical protein n=1 Tax=Lentimicrobium sp. L6 TaxID=2735916 RepID=UPI0015549026|nr:hypothetical protein [Lentimicrobium sp. L6]NPD84464.1 hypothetical protein [Lentimicrobium sp. L6]
MGFAESGATRLKNNRNLIGQKAKMNDAHLKLGKSNKNTKKHKNKMTKDEFDRFKFELQNKKETDNRRSVLTLVFLALLAILFVVLLLVFLN